MSILTPRRPRGFHHEYIYYDAREEKLRKIEERAKQELGLSNTSEQSYERLRGVFVNSTKHLRRFKEKNDAGHRQLSAIAIMLIIAVLVAVWAILSE